MILLIDGDNGPGVNTNNMEQLKDTDRAVIYYASDNKYYTKESNRTAVVEKSGCEVLFRCIPAGNCAVDLAVAMDSSVWVAELPGTTVVLVSRDKHFGTISKLACRRFGNCSIVHAATVDEAISRYRVLELSDLSDVRDWLAYTFGERKAGELFGKLEKMFIDKYISFSPFFHYKNDSQSFCCRFKRCTIVFQRRLMQWIKSKQAQ